MKEPTMDEVLKLVTFERDVNGALYVSDVLGNIWGTVKSDVCGSVLGDVRGSVLGDVQGSVLGDVQGSVGGKINGREWQYVETKQEKIIRLIREGKGEEAIKVLEEGE